MKIDMKNAVRRIYNIVTYTNYLKVKHKVQVGDKLSAKSVNFNQSYSLAEMSDGGM